MLEPIALPPSTLHLGQQVKVRWIDGKTTVGVLAGVDADAMHVVDGVADIRIPYSLIDVAVRIPAVAGDRTAEPMSDERLAEFRRRVEREHVVRMVGLGGPECSCGETVPCQERAAALALLDEVERLRAKVARDRDELRDKRNDLLEIRGILKPADQIEAVVSMPLGDMVAPAVQRLADDRDRLREELAEERERNTRIVLAKRTAERACAQMADRIDAGREQAVKDATRATDAEAERDRALTVAAAAERTLGEQIDRAIEAEEERDEARAALAAVAMVKVWTNEDGRKFVFVDDLMAALPVPAGPTALRHRMADAIVAHLHPPHEWPDGPPGEGEWERAVEEAQAIIAALTKAAE